MFIRQLNFLRKVQRQQWWSQKELQKFQLQKLKNLLNYVYKNNYYYKHKFKDINFHPSQFKKLSDLKKLPTINRKEIFLNYWNFISNPSKKNYFNQNLYNLKKTSGSTGHSFTILFDENTYDYQEAIYFRSFLGTGYNPFDRMVFYWYEPHPIKLFNYLGLIRKGYVPTTMKLYDQAQELVRLNPDVICYFPSALYLLSKKYPDLLSKLTINLVKTHAEIITPKMRKTIENVFNQPVYDFYGTSEFNNMAWECKKREGYHVNSDSIFMEITKDGESIVEEEPGDIVITDLNNVTFPLIRYEIGDVATPVADACSCGRGLPLIKNIDGRKNDFIHLHSNKLYSPYNLINQLIDDGYYDEFQLNQKSDRDIDFLFVSKYKSRQNFNTIKEKIINIFDNTYDINLKQVDEIPFTARGKYKFINGLPSKYYT